MSATHAGTGVLSLTQLFRWGGYGRYLRARESGIGKRAMQTLDRSMDRRGEQRDAQVALMPREVSAGACIGALT